MDMLKAGFFGFSTETYISPMHLYLNPEIGFHYPSQFHDPAVASLKFALLDWAITNTTYQQSYCKMKCLF